MIRFYFTSLGCKLNQAEVESLARQAERRGHSLVDTPQQADWAIVNTCTVTHVAARKSRQLIRQLRRSNPHLRLAVTGCYADISPQDIRSLAEIDLVVANTDKDSLVERILDMVSEQSIPAAITAPTRLQLGHTRAFVKIQDGCDNRCTFCVVHLARGRQRSRHPTEVVQEVMARTSEGYREIVLTGVNIGAYGRDSAPGAALPPSQNWSLPRLIRTILDQTTVERVRLSSIEPWDLTSELLELWAEQRLCRHIHLPLQSGSDAVLQRMGRRYDVAEYERWVRRIQDAIPEVSITTDLIVGFPGETDDDLEMTFSLVQRLELARLHVFQYSPRPRTAAASLPGQVGPAIAHERSQKLIALGRDLALAFHRRFVGGSLVVLFEDCRRQDERVVWSGLTDNYLRVEAPSADDLANVVARVHCHSADAYGLRGDIVSPIS